MTQSADNAMALRHRVAADLLSDFPKLGEDIEGRPSAAAQTTLAFIDELVASETPEDALAVCAYALPPRHAVWWGHECMMKIKDLVTEADLEFLKLASDWVADPSEERRAAAVEAAYPGETHPTPGQWIALGAGWTGGSMNPAAMPEVPPAPDLMPTAVNVGVMTALAAVDIAHREATIASFVKMARQLAQGQ